MKKILLGATILFAISVSVVHAQTITTSSTGAVLTTTITPAVLQQTLNKYNITFPIAALGNCTDFASCKTYCDDPTHLDVCVAYAKQKGFYTPTTLEKNQQQILNAAKTELGCTNVDSCKEYCDNPSNVTVCTQFATKHNLDAGNVDKLSSVQVLQNAEKTLGCNSQATCESFCSDAANQQKCTDFAKENDLTGGASMVGPGGCMTQDSCKEYCLDTSHLAECQKFGYHPQPSVSGQPSTVPGEPSQNPELNDISGMPQRMPSEQSNPQTMQERPNPQAECISDPHCTWMGNACKCVENSTQGTAPTIQSNQSTSNTTTFTNTSSTSNENGSNTMQQHEQPLPNREISPQVPSQIPQNPFPTVKGITTQRTWLEQILSLFNL